MDRYENCPSCLVLWRLHWCIGERAQIRIVQEYQGPDRVDAGRHCFLKKNEENGSHQDEVANDDKQKSEAANKHFYECHDQSRDGADYKEEGKEAYPRDENHSQLQVDHPTWDLFIHKVFGVQKSNKADVHTAVDQCIDDVAFGPNVKWYFVIAEDVKNELADHRDQASYSCCYAQVAQSFEVSNILFQKQVPRRLCKYFQLRVAKILEVLDVGVLKKADLEDCWEKCFVEQTRNRRLAEFVLDCKVFVFDVCFVVGA